MAEKKFLYCQNCKRHSWAKLEGVRWICLGCGREITYTEKDDEDISPPQHDSVSPKLERTGT